MLFASCHCGAVQIKVLQKLDSLTECNCSICRRYGALWAYCTSKTVEVLCPVNTLTRYTWGKKTLAFYHCLVCGCLTHYENNDQAGVYRVAVNARILKPTDIEGITIRLFDGAGSEQYISR